MGRKYGVKTLLSAVATAVFFMMMPLGSVSAGQEEGGNKWSVFAYGAQWTDTRIAQIIEGEIRRRSAYVWVAGVSREACRLSESLALELELNAGRHTGLQRHYEVNAAVSLRWERFPWGRYLNTSFAYGLGPSYAERRPPIEQRSRRGPTRMLVFMPVELTFGPPPAQGLPVELVLRLHHRSGAFGIVSDARGSNFLAGGLRYRW